MNNKEIAYYYPNPIWYNSDFIKNIILFFDGVGLLVPEYMKDDFRGLDPVMIDGLNEHNLLHIIEPEKAIDKETTTKLASALTDIIVSGAFDNLSTGETELEYLSGSRLGYNGDFGLAEMIFTELRSRKLADRTEDYRVIRVHRLVRGVILALLAQLTRPYGEILNIELNPVTDRYEFAQALKELLSMPETPSSGNVIAFDLNVVSADISAIPIDEILSFRNENFSLYSEYQRECKLFAFELSRISSEERELKFKQRQEKLNDLANHIKTTSKKAWKTPTSLALTLLGASWTIKTGDPVGAIISTVGGFLGLNKDKTELGAYTYLFKANRNW